MARRPSDPFDLKQKVNFYVSIGFIAAFGFLVSITVVHALNKDAAILEHIASPIDISA